MHCCGTVRRLSAVDLNPTNLTGYDGGAFALGTNGTVQVGFGRKGVNTFDGPFIPRIYERRRRYRG